MPRLSQEEKVTIKVLNSKNETNRAIAPRLGVSEGMARLFAILHKRLEDELPPLSCGKDAVGIREENAKALDEARKEAYEFFEGWTEG